MRVLHRMLLPLVIISVSVLVALIAPTLTVPAARADGAHIDAVTFQRTVDPASARFLDDAIDTAQHDGATLLLIRLDTPGGDLESMKLITEKELASKLPIVVYVAPQGGRAGSAGTFIALAAPIVAMAPNTRIGAASPINGNGQNLTSTLDTKIKNDLEALLRRMQTTYNRNVDLALRTVSDAAAYDDQEAIAQQLVTLGAASDADLLASLDGKSLTLASGPTVTLRAANLPVTELEPTVANKVETVLLDPNILFLLFIVAAICLYLELSHPGAIVPGTVGAIALVIFLFGSGALDPNYTGLVLMLLAVALLAVDLRVPTHGVLTFGAMISLVVGTLIYFDTGASPGAQPVNPYVLGGAAVAMGLISLFVISYIVGGRRGLVTAGGDGLIGTAATVTVPLAPTGRVRIYGEDWAARLAEPAATVVKVTGEPVAAQRQVRVKGRDRLTLIVEPLPPQVP